MPRRDTLTYISFGAGRQSTALVLLWANEDLRLRAWCAENGAPWPSYAVFADPGTEGPDTYRHVWETAAKLAALGKDLYVVRRPGPGLFEVMATQHRFSSIPAWTKTPDGKIAPLRRNCTQDYKIQPIHALARKVLGRRSMKGAEVWSLIGITTDEVQRAKPSQTAWEQRSYPLLDLGFDTAACVAYNATHGVTASKSACTACPYRSDAEWAEMRRNRPDEWADAVAWDNRLRHTAPRGGVLHDLYIHKSGRPLEECGFDDPTWTWDNECGGICGV